MWSIAEQSVILQTDNAPSGASSAVFEGMSHGNLFGEEVEVMR